MALCLGSETSFFGMHETVATPSVEGQITSGSLS